MELLQARSGEVAKLDQGISVMCKVIGVGMRRNILDSFFARCL